MKKTKIIATVNPSNCTDDMLIDLYKNGLNVVRINFSHADRESVREFMDRAKGLNLAGKTNIAFLLDTKGPEIRTGDVTEKIVFRKGEQFILSHDPIVGDSRKQLLCDYPYIAEDVSVGGSIEIDSGLFHTRVIKKEGGYVVLEAQNDAQIGSRRHINLPGVSLRLPGLTEKDKTDILLGIELGFHFIAASFIRTDDHVRTVREFLDTHGGQDIRIISKIENEEGIENLEAITEISDGIMVARGDLGIEMPIANIPLYQTQMVDLCRKKGKIVIVATQMLESMIEFPYPTRAEAGDIFHAVVQGTDATMLSGETAAGKYPIEAISMMNNIIQQAESHTRWDLTEYENIGLNSRDTEKKILIKSALMSADLLNIETVVIFTRSGKLARLAAAYRPNVRVIAFTGQETSCGFMKLLYGIEPIQLETWSPIHSENLMVALEYLRDKAGFSPENKVVVVTDLQREDKEIPVMEIIRIGDILV